MKIIKYALCAFLFGGLVSSCNFLDKEPYKLSPEKYFNNATEAESFLTGVYAILGQSTFYGENFMYLAGGDDLQHYGGTIIRKSKFPLNPERSVQISGKRTKRSVQKKAAHNTYKAGTKG